jgi:hypothetical protein
MLGKAAAALVGRFMVKPVRKERMEQQIQATRARKAETFCRPMDRKANLGAIPIGRPTQTQTSKGERKW